MKHLLSSIRIALRALQVNKVRSALTMLGIVIGVAAVIATAAIGSGATQRIQQQIASIAATPSSSSRGASRVPDCGWGPATP